MKKFLAIASLLLLISCVDTRVKKDLIALQSQPIRFPPNLITTINGKDTVIYNLYKSEYKLIIYVDSIACSSCEINHMHLWKPYIEYADSLSNDKLKLYFIFSPRKEDKKAIRVSLALYPIDYPVIIDNNNEFEKFNPHIPSNRAMHVFLLDSHNRVRLVGSPVANQEIRRLFYTVTKDI